VSIRSVGSNLLHSILLMFRISHFCQRTIQTTPRHFSHSAFIMSKYSKYSHKSAKESTYGIFVGVPSSYDQQTLQQDSKSPHIYLKFASAGTQSGGSTQSRGQSDYSSGRHEEHEEHHSKHHGHHGHGHEGREHEGREHESREHGSREHEGKSGQSHQSSGGSSSSSGQYEAAINVRSTDNVDQGALVAWIITNFSHPITQQLTSLENGFHAAQSGNDSERLDFVRTTPRLFQWSNGKIVNDENSATSGGSANILADLDPILQNAISNKSTIYVFGTSYGTGIDDIHMNQGNSGHYANSIYSDGGLLIKSGNSWQAVFLAFASQEVPTDNSGKPESGAQQIEDLVNGQGS